MLDLELMDEMAGQTRREMAMHYAVEIVKNNHNCVTAADVCDIAQKIDDWLGGDGTTLRQCMGSDHLN